MNKIRKLLLPNYVQLRAWKRQMSRVAALNVVSAWKRKFEDEKVDESDFAIKCIMSHVLNVDFAAIVNYNDWHFTDEQKEKFDKLCECRISRMPIQYVIGNWHFRNLILRMIPPVFIPRPETEQLVDLIVRDMKTPETLKCLEVGCGSGAISCSLLHELPIASIFALDCSRLACNLTRHNAKEAGVEQRLQIIHHKVTDEYPLPKEILNVKVNYIVSNPPYVKSADMLKLAPEIKLYEDLRALDGGPDGLSVVRALCRMASMNLEAGGKMWLEVDGPQIRTIREIISNNYKTSLTFVNTHKDMFGRERFVEIERQ